MNSFSRGYAEIYDEFYKDKDDLQEAEYVFNLIRKHRGLAEGLGLEIGAGTGRHTAHFLTLGLKIIASEPSESMAKIALTRGVKVRQLNAAEALRQVPQGSLSFVLALFHVVSYLDKSFELEETFTQVKHALRPEGIFIFDVWHKDAVESQCPEVRVKRCEIDSRKIYRLAEPLLHTEEQKVDVKYTFFAEEPNGLYRSWSDQHVLHYYSESEIETACRSAGMEIIDCHEFLTQDNPSADTWGVTYVARAKQRK